MAKPRLILRDLRHPRLPEGSYELNRSPIRIGRGPRCEIRLHSDRIADVQVILRQEAERWTLHPVGPAEGCEIHGSCLAESAVLEHGTTFRIGHVEMMLSLGTGRPTPTIENRPGQSNLPQEEPVSGLVQQGEAELPERIEQVTEPRQPAHLANLTHSDGSSAKVASESFDKADPSGEPSKVVASAEQPQGQPGIESEIAANEAIASKLGPTLAGFASPASAVLSALPPESPGSVTTGSVLFPENDSVAGISPVPKIPRNLRIGPLPSSTAAAAVSKAFGSFAGGHAAELAAARGPAIPRTTGIAPAALSETAPFDLEIPRHARRPATADSRSVPASSEGFEPGIAHTVSRSMPLKRYLRDHDSSTLFDGQMVGPITSEPASDRLVFDLPLTDSADTAVSDTIPAETESPETAEFSETKAHSPESIPPVAEISNDAHELIDQAARSPQTADSEHAEPVSPAAETVPPQGSLESDIAQFENWLQSVGPNLETAPPETDTNPQSGDTEANPAEGDCEITSPVATAHEFDPTELHASPETFTHIEQQPSDETVTGGSHGSIEYNPEINGHDPESGGIAVVEDLATLTRELFEHQPESKRFDSSRRDGGDPNPDFAQSRGDAHEWPSAQDILRWSADRHGRSFLLASTEDLKTLRVSPDRTRPREWFRMNFPTALILCLVWLIGAGFLATFGIRMSLQDELTQQSIAAVIAAEKSGAAPRLDQASMQRLTQPAPWWEVTPVQRWFRSVFVKMREEKGQPLGVSSEQMAAEVVSLDPLYAPARLWKSTATGAATAEPDLSALSLDILPLIIKADADRRRGDHEKANEADRVALKIASSIEKPLKDQEIAYDAEFGMRRFLLPGQKRILAILKRIVREPNAERLITAVMPDDTPLVWLTAAQLMRHAGVGDAESMANRASEWPMPDTASTERRQLYELVKAEANALLGRNDLAIETYDRLVKEIPDSEWKRTVYLNLGILNIQSLKPEAAKLALKKARGEDPYHEIDRHAIATIRDLSDTRPDGVRSASTVRAN